MQPILGVIADDLTGGMETAAMLVGLGVDCDFVTRPALIGETASSPAIVVAQKTRLIPAEDAIRRSEEAARALLAAGARRLFFKYCATFDSTDEGNIGPVADRLVEVLGVTHTAFCPATGDLARSVFNGHLFVGTQLVSESPKRFDPLTPMTDPDLVRVLQRQTKALVGLIPHNVVRADVAAQREHIETLLRQGVRHMIVDSIYEEDLDAIAWLTADWPLMTGNAPIVRRYPPIWRKRGWLDEAPPKRVLPAVNGGGVVLSGSCAERTPEQLADFERLRPVYRIDLASVESVESIVDEALNWAWARLDSGPVAVATSAGPAEVGAAQARFGRDGAAALGEQIPGRLSVELRKQGVKRFLVAGARLQGRLSKALASTACGLAPIKGQASRVRPASGTRSLRLASSRESSGQ